jgi:hypothetical protein
MREIADVVPSCDGWMVMLFPPLSQGHPHPPHRSHQSSPRSHHCIAKLLSLPRPPHSLLRHRLPHELLPPPPPLSLSMRRGQRRKQAACPRHHSPLLLHHRTPPRRNPHKRQISQPTWLPWPSRIHPPHRPLHHSPNPLRQSLDQLLQPLLLYHRYVTIVILSLASNE